MGLFSKKEACPVCGGEVKGLFLTKIGGKKILCKDCSGRISMNKALLENAAPEFIKEHLDYRQKNAEKYASHNWDVKFNAVLGLEVGLDKAGQAVYLIHKDLHDEENPVVFSFGQLTGYELFRGKKKLDGMENTGAIPLETGLSALAGLAKLASSNNTSPNMNSFRLKLAAADPYWEEIDLKLEFTDDQLYGLGGFAEQFKEICQLFKDIIRKEPLKYTR